MNPTKKTCFKCLKTLSIEAFYKHAMMRDGHLNKCKECTKSDAITNRMAKIEHCRQYDRLRASVPHRVQQRKEYFAEYISKFPNRRKANTAVANALRDGRLQKLPCIVCGSTKSVAHHPNYDAPLDVVWLCQPHHKAAHALAKE